MEKGIVGIMVRLERESYRAGGVVQGKGRGRRTLEEAIGGARKRVWASQGVIHIRLVPE